MTEIESEQFSVGLRIGGGEIIGFHIKATSTAPKRIMFFGLLSMVVVMQIVVVAAPTIERFTQ